MLRSFETEMAAVSGRQQLKTQYRSLFGLIAACPNLERTVCPSYVGES
jgi:hypothetical protein